MKQRKKIIWYSVLMVLTFFCFGLRVQANEVEDIRPIEIGKEETQNQISEQQIIDYGINLLDWDSINALQEELADAMPKDISFDLKSEMQKLIQGDAGITVGSVLAYVGGILLSEIGVFLQLGARFILIVLLCNLLQTLSSAFKSKNTSKVAFFVCYMAILLSVIQSFRVMIELATNLIDQVTHLMMVVIPIMLAFMATSGFNLSAGMMAPVIISTLNLLSYLVKVIVLPCIISVVVLEIVSSMSEEFKVNKLIGLFYKGIKWGLTSVLGVSVGLLSLYRFTITGVDTTAKSATVKFSSAFIPVVGNAIGGSVEFITNISTLIKNTFGGGIIIWILVLASIPMIKLLAYVCIYQVAGAVIEPMGDKKMASIATKLGKGCQFIMSSAGIVVLFGICAIMICMSISAAGV
ncbi:MAG: stage III sporulation protein AE [Cellulosilyticum sp.]|nr:stage III sporulation protein AE [Cellulosilyticum sp.]